MQDVETVTVDRVFRPKITECDAQADGLRTLRKQAAVAKNDRLRRPVISGQTQTEFRSDAGRFAAGNGDARRHHFSSRRFST